MPDARCFPIAFHPILLQGDSAGAHALRPDSPGIHIWDLAGVCEHADTRTVIPDDAAGLPPETLNHLRETAVRLSTTSLMTVCAMGENRSGLASALVLIARGYSAMSALDLVRARVPPHPATGQPRVLWNPGFVRQLLG